MDLYGEEANENNSIDIDQFLHNTMFSGNVVDSSVTIDNGLVENENDLVEDHKVIIDEKKEEDLARENYQVDFNIDSSTAVSIEGNDDSVQDLVFTEEIPIQNVGNDEDIAKLFNETD